MGNLLRRRMMLQNGDGVTWNSITSGAYSAWLRNGGNNTTLTGNTFRLNVAEGENWSYWVATKPLIYKISDVVGKRVRFRGHVTTTGAGSTSRFFISWFSSPSANTTWSRTHFYDMFVTAGTNIDQDFDIIFPLDMTSWTQNQYLGARLYVYSGTNGYVVLVTNPILEVEG